MSAATLYNWRRVYSGMATDAAKELKELREQNGRLKRLLAEAEWEKDALGRWRRENLSPTAKWRAVDILKATLSISERLACKAVGLAEPPFATSCRRKPLMISMRRCGPGCAGTRRNAPAMGFWGGPGRRCATTRAVRSPRRRSADCCAQAAQAGRGVLDPADRG